MMKRTINNMSETILKLMARIDNFETKQTFEDLHPQLTTLVWDAIDSKNAAKLTQVINLIEDIERGES